MSLNANVIASSGVLSGWNPQKKPYIDVYQPIAGWKAINLWWNTEEKGLEDGFWEPWQTGEFAFATKEEACKDAEYWAMAEELWMSEDLARAIGKKADHYVKNGQ